MPLHEVGALHKHAARAAGRIKNPPMERLDHFNDERDQGCRRVKLSTFLLFGHSELPEEVLIDPAEDIPVEIHGDL